MEVLISDLILRARSCAHTLPYRFATTLSSTIQKHGPADGLPDYLLPVFATSIRAARLCYQHACYLSSAQRKKS